jgi:hypothetical protein
MDMKLGIEGIKGYIESYNFLVFFKMKINYGYDFVIVDEG